MKARQRPVQPLGPEGIPEQLLAFDPADWTDVLDPMLRRVAWQRARQAWEKAHDRCGPRQADDRFHREHQHGPTNFVTRCTCPDPAA